MFNFDTNHEKMVKTKEEKAKDLWQDAIEELEEFEKEMTGE